MNKLIQYGLTVVIGVVLFASLLVPCVNTATTQINTTTIDNDGAGWLKLGYNAGEDYDFNIAIDDTVTVGEQSGALGDMIYYADPDRAIISNDNGVYLIEGGEAPSVHAFEEDISVTSANGSITIKDGTTDVINTTAPAWAYVPDSAGVYGFFTDGGLNLDDKPKVAIGDYAGVFAYNDVVVGVSGYSDYGLIKSGDYSTGAVNWVMPPEEEAQLNLSRADIDLNPATIEPIDRDLNDSVGLMAVPTPSYTTGDWGYNIYSNNRYWIVAYIGEGGDVISPPVSVDGNAFYSFGNNNEVFPAGVHINKVIIPEGFGNMAAKAFYGADIDYVIIPDSIKSLANETFSNSSIKHLDLPINNKSLGYAAKIVSGCPNLTGMVILPGASTTAPASDMLQGATALKEVLNLSDLNITTTSYGLNADSVQDHIDALGYIAPVSIHESEIVPVDTPAAQILGILPLIVIGGLIAGVVGSVVVRRYS